MMTELCPFDKHSLTLHNILVSWLVFFLYIIHILFKHLQILSSNYLMSLDFSFLYQ